MIKPTRPWVTPPAGPFRSEPYRCHNCNSEEKTLGVGGWLADNLTLQNYSRNKLVLCEKCFNKLSDEIVGVNRIKSFFTRIKILFTGKLR